ncbi:MAG: UDP-N-acetylglucosamine 2-epimerase (non-hydrolyzing) [Candidatus Aminicenantes bacterium]|nr:UDP-N-acetylglucosamine 2-epimerase (non-hydrolyzing) [Candidatus Aminicenantes bacterium]
MRRIRVLVVVGTRPEAIKLAPVIDRLRRGHSRFRVRVCATAQHRHLLDQVLEAFAIVPDIDLDLMRARQELSDVAARVVSAMRPVIQAEKPDVVVVQGDTTSAFAAALAAFHLRVPVAHVEAGLRTFDMLFPFPEEANRRLISVLADFHFAPTAGARRNLLKAGAPAGRVWVTGNTVVDALGMIRRRLRNPQARRRWQEYFRSRHGLEIGGGAGPLVLVTGHRRENFGRPLQQVCLALRDIARREPRLRIIYPLHLNPCVRGPVRALLVGVPNIHIIEPPAYEPFVFLMDHARLILTDSGGIQEEAPSLGKPVLVMRRVTERPEGVRSGIVELVGSERRAIAGRALELLRDAAAYRRMARVTHPYGDGRAAQRIAAILARELGRA